MSAGAEDVERLRRIAYGPDATPRERAEAEVSLREREAQAQAQAHTVTLAAEAEVPDDSMVQVEQSDVSGDDPFEGNPGVESDAIDDGEEEPSLWNRRIRVGWVIPIAVGAVLLGAAVALGASGQFDRVTGPATASPAPTVIEIPEEGTEAGDLNAADRWFDRPFEDSDAFSQPALLESGVIDEHDVRLALDGGELGSVWVGRTDDKLCLLIAIAKEESGASSCIEREQFQSNGLRLRSDKLSASWNGWEVTSDPYIGPRPHVSAPASGDVDAANSWFEQIATEDDVYPISGILDHMGVDQSQVRQVGRSDGGPQVWVMKQGDTGFCLASYDPTQDRGQGQGKGEWNCATIEEFEAHGVTLSTSTIAVAWDGAMIAMSGGG